MRAYGFILTITLIAWGGFPSWADTTVDYSYDSLGRLTGVHYQGAAPLGTVTYSYDATGNIQVATVASLVLRGDLNLDGTIDLADTILGLKMLAGYDVPELSASADIDNDHRIGLSEVIYTLTRIAFE